METPKKPFSLIRFQGIGGHMGSVVPVLSVDGRMIGVSLLSFTFLFLPIIPLSWHMVEDCGDSYRFLGKLSSSVCNDAFGSGFAGKAYFKEAIKGAGILAAFFLIFAIIAASRK
ncbi:MAG: hypothetical protein ACOH2B_01355 [Burkholderiaceae bacterium]